MKHLSTSLIFAVLAWGATAQLHAFDCGLPYFAYGYSGSLYGLGYVPVPPYFALHPPVQYTRPIGVAYGQSPFAVERHEQRFVIEPPAARTIINPFAAAASASASTPPSQIIVNPYYKQGGEPIPAKPADTPEPVERAEKP
jgi:hypothetical protein